MHVKGRHRLFKRAGNHSGLLTVHQKYSHLYPSSRIPCLDAEKALTSNITEVEVEVEVKVFSFGKSVALVLIQKKNQMVHLGYLPRQSWKKIVGHCSIKGRGSCFYHNPSPPHQSILGDLAKASDYITQINIALGVGVTFFS